MSSAAHSERRGQFLAVLAFGGWAAAIAVAPSAGVKALLDGVVSIVFASTLGWGVGFSVLTILVYQGGLTAAAGAADSVLTGRMVAEMTATGGLMIIGIGLRLLDLKQVRVASFLPGLIIAPVAVALFGR